ncbi:hypothetical protein PG996_014669 [Apiospora saccharicola]|uniref:Uncharacterized protein n=1 Tax=Apiospora saccharicola TaxID=335842 RepID=A0ABR1TIY2_9PEZI
MALSRIEQLSPELKQLVLTYAADWPSLRSAVLSCPAFYLAFKGAEPWIARRFVENLIGPGALPEALLAQGLRRRATAGGSSPESAEAAESWLAAELRKKRRVVTQEQSLWAGDAIAMSRLHHIVERFVDEYIHHCQIVTLPPGCPRPAYTFQKRPLTDTERARISRALYLWEMWSRLHRCGAPCAQAGYRLPDDIYGTKEVTQHPFFSALLPWEKEQLLCINDALNYFESSECVKPLFHNRLTFPNERDMTEPERELWSALRNRSMVQLGLETSHEASIAPDPARRTELLLQGQTVEELRQSTYPPQLWNILNTLQGCQDYFLEGIDGIELFLRGTSERGEDAESVPREVWTWVNTGIGWGRQAGDIGPERKLQRLKALGNVRCTGLVMWDHTRLYRTGVFRKDVESWLVSRRKQQ